MNLLNKYFKILLVFFFFYSCSTKITKDDILSDYLKSQNIQINSNTKALIVISDNSCLVCNKEFAEFSQSFLSLNSVKYIIATDGGLFDISMFEEKSNNVFFDENQEIIKNGIMKNSGVIFLNPEFKIDTIVNIKAENINEVLSYIKTKINNY